MCGLLPYKFSSRNKNKQRSGNYKTMKVRNNNKTKRRKKIISKSKNNNYNSNNNDIKDEQNHRFDITDIYINIYIVNGIKSNKDDIVKLGKGSYQLKRQIDYSSIFRLFKNTDNSIFFEASSN